MTLSTGTTSLEPSFGGDHRLHDVRQFLEAESTRSFNPVKLVIRLLRGRWLRVLLLALLCALVFAAVGFNAVNPAYQSQGLIRISAKESTILYADANDARLKLFDAFVSGEVTYLSSRPVLERALAMIASVDAFRVPAPEDISKLARMISISRSKGLILVSARSVDPQLAAVAVNAVIDAYLSLHNEQEQSRQSYREQELVTREAELLERLEEIKRRSLKVGGEYGINSLLKAHIAKVAQIEEQEQRIDELAGTIAQLETVGSASAVDTGDLEIKRATLLDRALADMTYDRAKRAASLETLRQRYTPSNPIVVKAKSELTVLDKAIEQRREQIATLGRTGALTGTGDGDRDQSIDELKSLLDKLTARQVVRRKEAKSLNGKLVELRFLGEERTGVRVLLNETRRVLDQVRVESRNSLPGVVEVLSRGSLPDQAIEDKRPQIAILGGGVGCGLALSVFLGLALLRPCTRYSDDLDMLSDRAPVVAVLPRTKEIEAGEFRSSVDRLRNTIQLLPGSGHDFQRHARVVGITGVEEGCGTTTLTLVLAESFADSGLKTLVVDADLIAGDLTQRFEAGEDEGWRELLSGVGRTVTTKTLRHGLDLLPAGCAPGVQDMGVSLPRLRQALAKVADAHDVIVLDLGAFRTHLAAGLVTSQADLTVVVSRPGESLGQLRRLLGSLDRIAPGSTCQVFNFATRGDPELSEAAS